MATSAKKEVTCGYNDHYHLYISMVVNKQDAANNKSNVTVKLYAKSDSATYKYQGSSTVKLTVGGTQRINKSISVNFSDKATVALAEWTGDIVHDSDGKKTLSYSGSFTASSDWLNGGSISNSTALDIIPRATKPTLSASSVELGKAITVKISGAVSTWTHALYYRIGTGSWTKVTDGLKANYSWTTPLSIASSFPSATSGTITIGLNTYNNGTKIGSTQTVDLKVTVPASIKPSVSSVAISEMASGLSAYGYVQNKSLLKIVASASGSYGSEIKSYKYAIGSQNYTGTSGTYAMQETVRSSGTVTVKVTVTDSRGRMGEKSATITVQAYHVPQITRFACNRCDSSGNIDDNGKNLSVSMAFSVSSLGNKNTGKYIIAYRKSTETTWTEKASGSLYDYDNIYVSTSECLDTNVGYVIRLTVKDDFTQAQIEKEVGSGARLMSYVIKKMALAVGKIAETANTFEVALAAVFRNGIKCLKSVYFTDTNITAGLVWQNQAWQDDDDTTGVYKHNIALQGGSSSTARAIFLKDQNNKLYVWEYDDTNQTLTINAKTKLPIIQKTLWSGAVWPNDSQTITFSEKVSQQANGIVLVFCRYNSGALDENFICRYVPKRMVSLKPGKGHTFPLFSGNLSAAVKYIYISDDRLTGHANNTASGTANSGIKYQNDYFCLRYVLGV